METEIIKQRVNKTIFIKNDRLYKVFAPGYNKADILNEALNQARVQETGLNIPELYEVTTIEGRWSIVMQAIKGKTLEKLISENPEKLDEYLKRFVGIQMNMHTKRCPLLNMHHDKMNRKISQTDLSATFRYDLHKRIEEMPNYTHLCHGDYNPSNVIISENDEAYIIDWSHATQGNREADAARTYLLFLLANQQHTARKYIDLFCAESGCSLNDILNWLPILAASQSVKGYKNESRFLQNIIFTNEKGLRQLYENV